MSETRSLSLRDLLSEYWEIRGCRRDAPWRGCTDQSVSNLDHFDGHIDALDTVVAKAEDVLRSQEPVQAQYPCDKCGMMRTKEEGGTVFTVCDKCWDTPVSAERST